MAGEQIILDPTSEDATNTQLDITSSGAGYWLIEHAYPPPDDDEVWASSADTEGARRANTRPQNRTITATVRCREASGTPVIGTIVGKLQQKIGKLNREGGTYKRVLPSGDVIVFAVLAARVVEVPSDQAWATLKKADVKLQFTCQPHGLGASVTLTAHTASDTKAPLEFVETGIKGDVPALGTLDIVNATNQKRYAIWGIQSRYYDASSSAELFWQAEAQGSLSGLVADPGFTGASGSGTNKVLRGTNISNGLLTSFALNQPVHRGSFRVFARIQASSTNTGIVSARVSWSRRRLGPVTNNDFVPLVDTSGAAVKGKWLLVDLGMVTTVGQQWTAAIYVQSPISTDDVDIDWVMLMPVDEGSGVLTSETDAQTTRPIASTGHVIIANDRAELYDGSTTYYDAASYEGDYLLAPPAGLESRSARFIVLLTGNGIAANTLADGLYDATNFDAITATLTYRPRYLVVPEP